jgi:hypothetical protein
MNRIRFRSPLRAIVYESRGLFLWWGALAAATSAVLLWGIREIHPNAFLPASIVVAAAWMAPLVSIWSLLAPRRPEALPANEDDREGWKKALRALARFLIYQETRGTCSKETKSVLHEGEKQVRAAFKGVYGAHRMKETWEAVRESAVRAWAEETWEAVRPEILAIWREEPPEGADRHQHRSSLNWRAARAVFRRTMPQLLATDRSRWEIRCEILALFCALDGTFPGLPVPVLSGLFAMVLSDLSLPWDPDTAIRAIRPWAERETRLLAGAVPGREQARTAGSEQPLAGVLLDPVRDPASPAEASGTSHRGWTRELPETGLAQDPTTSRVPPRPIGTVHFPTHAHAPGDGVRRHRHRHRRHRSFRSRILRDIARIGEAFLTFGQRLRYTFRIWRLRH